MLARVVIAVFEKDQQERFNDSARDEQRQEVYDQLIIIDHGVDV